MKTTVIAAVAIIALSGCRGPVYGLADDRVLCSLDGKSYIVRPSVGNTSFVKRSGDADPLCKPFAPVDETQQKETK